MVDYVMTETEKDSMTAKELVGKFATLDVREISASFSGRCRMAGVLVLNAGMPPIK